MTNRAVAPKMESDAPACSNDALLASSAPAVD